MFSEYASRFLAQSQSRITFEQHDSSSSRNEAERPRDSNAGKSPRASLQRSLASTRSPSDTRRTSRFPFASRSTPRSAPLFYSAANDFQEEDDGQEHEREAADLHALRSSRRDFGAGRLSGSSDGTSVSGDERRRRGGDMASGRLQAKGIRSSWIGDDSEASSKAMEDPTSFADGTASAASDGLIEVELASTVQDRNTGLHTKNTDDNSPSLQQIRTDTHGKLSKADPDESSSFLSGQDAPSPGLQIKSSETVTHYDSIFGSLFLITLAAMFASFLLVLLHTSTAKRGARLRGTVYTTIHENFTLLGVDTLIAILVSGLWIAGLRAHVRPVVLLMLGAVPVVAVSASFYLLIASLSGGSGSASLQERVMRWVALGSIIFAVLWTITALRGLQSIDRAIDLLKFTTRILGDCPILFLAGFATLGITVTWTWLYLLMFARIFFAYQPGRGIWWFAAFSSFTFAWSLRVISGLQRAVVSAIVSDWYFYRRHTPKSLTVGIAGAAFTHSTDRLFGTVCLSALVSLLLRLPFLLLPSRLVGGLSYILSPFLGVTTAALTNPLVLTYASTHSRKYNESARRLSELSLDMRGNASFVALARLFLHAQRLCASLAFGFGGWVSVARMHAEGSRNAYVVGLAAAGIGWTVLGCAENVIGQVLDSVLICWASEGDSEARFCVEAHDLLRDRGVIEV